MARPCVVCTHIKRAAINRELLANVPFRTLERRYKVSRTALFHHKEDHMPAQMVKAEQVAEVVRASSLLDQLQDLAGEAHSIKAKAEASGDYRAALMGVRELVRIVELLAKLQGAIQDQTNVNVLVTSSSEWLAIRARLLRVLESYPEAKAAVVTALQGELDAPRR